jgi:hypothetical protein
MNISEFSIIFGGLLSLVMVVFHTRFYILFGWKSEFEKIQTRNNRIIYTIHIALILFFVIFSILSFVYYKELADATGLAFGVVLLYTLFWLWRTIWQVIYFRHPKGVKKSALHYIVLLIFSLLLISYLIPVILKTGM